MAKAHYNKILTELPVGSKVLPNRIIFGAHPTNFAKRNLLSEQHVAYYRERARGGAGMIVIEEQLVHPSDLPYEKAPYGYLKEIIPGYRKVARAVHDHGSLVIAQLNHSGMQSEGSTSMRELWAPSAVPDVVSREVPKSMEAEDIEAIITGFAAVALHTVEGELDGVEINAGQFSLLRQFMSPLTNQRSDLYGGELTNRLRLTVEVLKAVRSSLGRDKILGIRLCGDEFAPWGGLTPDDAVTIAQQIESLGLVDYLSLSVGSLFSLQFSTPTFYTEPGMAVNVAARVKQTVKIPVFAEGRIHRPEYAASIIEDNLVDGVYMNRALICDPELPVKLSSGREGRIRPCLACNQGCQVRRNLGKTLACMLNPVAGVEARERIQTPAEVKKKVLVVGGGPGGMEAARVAASRGHKVTIWEAGPELGGAAKLGLPEFAGVLAFWQNELNDRGVTVVTQKQAGTEEILAEDPEVIILATGAIPGKPPLADQDWVSARDVIAGTVVIGKNILVWDEVGNQVMARAVEKLVAAGNKISLVTTDWFAASKLAETMELSNWNQRVMSGATRIYTTSKIREIRANEAVVENVFSGKSETLTGIDLFVCNCWSKPNESLYPSLKHSTKDLYRVGDCLAPRGVGAAVREGYQVGSSI